MLKVSK